MKKWLVFLFIIFCTINIFSQPNIPVFESGKDGHKSYRIPAIIKLNNGHLLAFAEGRVQGASDFGDVNIVLKQLLIMIPCRPETLRLLLTSQIQLTQLVGYFYFIRPVINMKAM